MHAHSLVTVVLSKQGGSSRAWWGAYSAIEYGTVMLKGARQVQNASNISYGFLDFLSCRIDVEYAPYVFSRNPAREIVVLEKVGGTGDQAPVL